MTDRLAVTLLQRAALGGILLGLVACAPKGVESKRFFWPPGLVEPKIEYINFYQVDQDVLRGEDRWLEESIFGREKPKFIFSRPQSIVSDGAGRVFVSDIGQARVYIYDLAKREVRKLLQKGQDGLFDFPRPAWGLAVTSNGAVLAALPDAGEIALFGVDETYVRSFGQGHLKRPIGLAVDERQERVYVADSEAHQIVVFDLDGEFFGLWGARGDAKGQFNYPVDVAVDAQGQVYVLDTMNARIQVFDAQGHFLRLFGERGTASGSFMIAKSLAISPQGHIYVTDSLGHKIIVFDRDGQYLLTFGGRAVVTDKVQPGGFYLPEGIDVDRNSSIWVVDSLNRMFHRFQYLDAAYLKDHPILPEQTYLPSSLLPGGGGGAATATPAKP